MLLPYKDKAFIDIVKLRDYCLNLNHPRGKHKARVFKSVLGLTSDNAEELHSAILSGIQTAEAVEGEHDDYGRRFFVDVKTQMVGVSAIIRTSWIIRRNEDFPRLTSCYIL